MSWTALTGAILAAAILPVDADAASAVKSIMLVDADATGIPANNGSFAPAFSPDGRYVVFDSTATNLASGDTSSFSDIYLKDLRTKQIVRLTMGLKGAEPDNSSWGARFTPDGKSIFFTTAATNLVARDNNNATDIILLSLKPRLYKLISTGKSGQGNGASRNPVISADGKRIAFDSAASNLTTNDKNGQADIFIKTLGTGAVDLVSLTGSGAQSDDSCGSPAFSPDGNSIAFETAASNFVTNFTRVGQIIVRNLKTGKILRASEPASHLQPFSYSRAAVFSPSGTEIAFESEASNLVSNDINNASDIFIKTLATGKMRVASVSKRNHQGDLGSISVVYSPDGKRIAFASDANNLVPGDTNGVRDIFVAELATRKITRVSVAPDGTQGNFASNHPVFSQDGKKIAFESRATTFVSGVSLMDHIYVVTLAP